MRNYQLEFPENYTVVDIETTGLNSNNDAIIEIAAIKVVNHEIKATYSELIDPLRPISPFITQLTGISNEMVENCQPLEMILPSFLDFVMEDKIVGHNINFDLSFLRCKCDALGLAELENEGVDTLKLSRSLLPQLPHHRLQDLVAYFNIKTTGAHRALADCYSTKALYDELRKLYEKAQERQAAALTKNYETFKNCHFVTAGALSIISRRGLKLLLKQRGAYLDDALVISTDYLVLGGLDQAYTQTLKLQGQPFTIISEKELIDRLRNLYEE